MMRSEPPPSPPGQGSPVSMGQLGMVVLLISISVLFIAASVAVVITRHQVAVWRLPGQARLPWGTAGSTLLLGVVSWKLQHALGCIRNNRFTECLQSWRWALVAAVGFLVAQALNARHLLNVEGEQASRSLFVFCYDLLVGLHALHVLGGFVPLVLVHAGVARRDYSSSRHSGLTFCVQYWHYLGVVWLILLGTLAWIG
jgi:cytochrome c oxidase subunit 3